MPAAEDRQAKALEHIAHEVRKIGRIFEALNENVVAIGKMLAGVEEPTAESTTDDNQLKLEG